MKIALNVTVTVEDKKMGAAILNLLNLFANAPHHYDLRSVNVHEDVPMPVVGMHLPNDFLPPDLQEVIDLARKQMKDLEADKEKWKGDDE